MQRICIWRRSKGCESLSSEEFEHLQVELGTGFNFVYDTGSGGGLVVRGCIKYLLQRTLFQLVSVPSKMIAHLDV